MKQQYKILIIVHLLTAGIYNMSCTSAQDAGLRKDENQLMYINTSDTYKDNYSLRKISDKESVEAKTAVTSDIAPLAVAELKSGAQPNECGTSHFVLPKHVKFKILQSHDKYNMQVLDKQNKPVAFIKQQSSTSPRFEIFDQHDSLVVIGRQKMHSWGAQLELYNCSNELIGSIKQNVEKSFLSAEASYSISDENNNLIFQSEKKSEDSKFISMMDASASEIGTISFVKKDSAYEASLNQEASSHEAFFVISTMKLYADPKM